MLILARPPPPWCPGPTLVLLGRSSNWTPTQWARGGAVCADFDTVTRRACVAGREAKTDKHENRPTTKGHDHGTEVEERFFPRLTVCQTG